MANASIFLEQPCAMTHVRPPAVAGTWYPGSADALAAAVDGYLDPAEVQPRMTSVDALIAPHAGLMYSGPVAAHAYGQLRNRDVDVVVLVGPSHFVAFDGVSIYRTGGFDSPLGVAPVDEGVATRIMAASPVVREHPSAHVREHSLEMQLPFVRRILPNAAIVPLVIGTQTADVARELGRALADGVRDTNAVLVASSDLSHYRDAAAAQALDAEVIAAVEAFDPDRLQTLLDRRPDHACGGGAIVAVMRAAKSRGARDAVVLDYGDSGDVSGDKSAVVGYLAAGFGAR